MPDLRSLLGDGRVHLVDGAMGTMLYEQGIFVNVCYDELNATRPELVEEVHRQYLWAGAEILETNTFGASPVKLSAYRLDDRTEELNRRAAEIALRAAGGRAAVAGAVGPLGIRVEPLGPTSLREARACFGRQVDGLLEGGVQGFVLETFSELAELEQALLAVKERSDLPVIAQVTVGEDGSTEFGATVEQAARAIERGGADVAGLNCSVGPSVLLEALERMSSATSLPLSAQPNAGLPRTVQERKIYLTRPAYMARYARRFISAGARLVGGCCGTTPEHTRRIGEQVAQLQPRKPIAVVDRPSHSRSGVPPIPLAERSRLGSSLVRRLTVVSVRVAPPRGWDTAVLVEECRALAEAGATVVCVHEDRVAPRLGGLAAAAAIQRALPELEVLLEHRCRDHKLSAMVSDLFSAAATGLRNVLLVTGDPPGPGPYPDYSSTVEVDSIGLANVVAGLNAGLDPSGNRIGAAAGFVVGVSANQSARDMERELGRYRWKVEAGADFALSRPVFEVGQLERFMKASGTRIPLVAEIALLGSARQAEFLRNEVPTVHLPAWVAERMRRAEARGARRAAAEGAAIARETAEALLGRVAGIQIAPPPGGAEAAAELLRALTLVRPSPPLADDR
ncbi:MAG: bifunctional homocysteine S-methyltransferase/methylenetetrahydrofolate reductase [Gemmatimonadetes bacterium]|nr:bifunctional homocysteine S-methyltransferase/methylenetetrahydrofolate reductase [Gemmatimonadota bacterium]